MQLWALLTYLTLDPVRQSVQSVTAATIEVGKQKPAAEK